MISFEEIRDRARSFPGLIPPGKLVAVEKESGNIWYYYLGVDEEGEEAYYYENTHGYAFKLHMEELRRKRNKEKRR